MSSYQNPAPPPLFPRPQPPNAARYCHPLRHILLFNTLPDVNAGPATSISTQQQQAQHPQQAQFQAPLTHSEREALLTTYRLLVMLTGKASEPQWADWRRLLDWTVYHLVTGVEVARDLGAIRGACEVAVGRWREVEGEEKARRREARRELERRVEEERGR